MTFRGPPATSIAIIGCAGIPNRYGGFESFAEHMAPYLVAQGCSVTVTCDPALYRDDLSPMFKGVRRLFLPVRANGALSPVHDVAAFFAVVARVDAVLVLGVSGGIFFPIFRLVCRIFGCRLLVNVDGVEWRRSKFGRAKRAFLYVSDRAAQRFAHAVIYDNEALSPFVRHPCKSRCIAYSGDHARRAPAESTRERIGVSGEYALTICRIEPENNCGLLIEGFLRSSCPAYVFVGNWAASPYGRDVRARYGANQRLMLLDPIYDAATVFSLRSGCRHYLHGHSVGGTNPSLVEMLYFDCAILCYDCSFNRATAGDGVAYFDTAEALGAALQQSPAIDPTRRGALRIAYSATTIGEQLSQVLNIAGKAG